MRTDVGGTISVVVERDGKLSVEAVTGGGGR